MYINLAYEWLKKGAISGNFLYRGKKPTGVPSTLRTTSSMNVFHKHKELTEAPKATSPKVLRTMEDRARITNYVPNNKVCASVWHVCSSSRVALRDLTRSHRCTRPVSTSLAHTLCNLPPCSGWLELFPHTHACFSIRLSNAKAVVTLCGLLKIKTNKKSIFWSY